MNLRALEEMRDLSRRLNQQGREHHAGSGVMTLRYRQLAEQLKLAPAVNDAVLEQKAILMSERRYCEAIQLLEERLAENPKDMRSHRNFYNTLADVHKAMHELAKTTPEHAEFGRTYEKLVSLGYVGSDLHIGAVRHYLASGRPERALALLLNIAKVASHSPGVISAALALVGQSDDLRVSKLLSLMNLEEK